MTLRTYRFACLGMSLANSFDVKDPQDFLRVLSNALNEYDQSKEDGDRQTKMVIHPECYAWPCILIENVSVPFSSQDGQNNDRMAQQTIQYRTQILQRHPT